MIKKIALAFGLTLGLATSAMAWDVSEMNKEIDQTNFIVGEGRGWCSATLISLEHRLLLTNHHCVDKLIRTETKDVVGADGEITKKTYQKLTPVEVSQKTYSGHKIVSSSSFVAEVEAYDEQNDLALLQLRANTIPHSIAATIYDGEVPIVRGIEVISVGNPRMLEASVSRGVISSTNRLLRVGGKEIPYYQMDVNITGGSSGGALYNTSGELIGVPGAGSQDGVISLAIPDTRIREFLNESCYEEIWNSGEKVKSFEECVEEEETEESVDE